MIHKKSTIEGNKAKISGGGIYTSSTQLAVVESKMISNIALNNIGNEIYNDNVQMHTEMKVSMVNIQLNKNIVKSTSFAGNNCDINGNKSSKSFCGFTACKKLKSEFCKYACGCSENVETIGLTCKPSPYFYCTFTKNNVLENNCIMKTGLNIPFDPWKITGKKVTATKIYALASPLLHFRTSLTSDQEISYELFNIEGNGALILENLDISGGYLNDTALNGIIQVSGKNAILKMKNCRVHNHISIGIV